MKTLLERIAQGGILVSDGAMGTFLHAKGLAAGGCPESWCVSHPDVVRGIAEAYIAAGAGIVETNSFGGSAFKLKPYGLAERVAEFNRAAAAVVHIGNALAAPGHLGMRSIPAAWRQRRAPSRQGVSREHHQQQQSEAGGRSPSCAR
jgi:S-methylmethionine-dependent homocysteine/selenocysteine methylase